MKKSLKILILIIIIVILSVCLYFAYKQLNKSQKAQNYEDLELYLLDIYGRTFLIPEFDDINDADENWLWENVNQYVWNHDDEFHEQNNQEYGYTYDEVSKIVKTLYGDNLKKQFPKGAVSMRYNNYRDLYGPTSFDTPFYYNYQIDKIEKSGNTYTVSLYDYVISLYFSYGDDETDENDFTVFNTYDYILNGDEGATPLVSVASLKDEKFVNLLNEKEKLSHKILTIEYDEQTNQYHIISCKYEGTKPEEILSNVYSDMKESFEIYAITYDRDAIYTQDEVLVENFDELSSIYTENALETYKNEMDLFVYKDNGEVYITAGDINIANYLVKTEFKDIEESDDKISATAVRTFREDWYEESEGYNKIYQVENKFTIVKKDGKWYVDEFSYNGDLSHSIVSEGGEEENS